MQKYYLKRYIIAAIILSLLQRSMKRILFQNTHVNIRDYNDVLLEINLKMIYLYTYKNTLLFRNIIWHEYYDLLI